jgi:hypothetical protein
MSPSPLLGYNTNVRHKGKVFHIQTEDSGVKYGHIMTHLFMDGGRILKSVKTSYAEYIGNERMSDIVREMMKQQHKAMFIALRDGKFDSLDQSLSDAPPPSRTAPARQAAPRATTASGGRDAEGGRAAAEDLMLDMDALERAAALDSSPPSMRGPSDLPPPPAHLLREKKVPSGGPPSAAKPPRRPPSTAPASSGSQAERRYAPTRPASIFGQARPQRGKSIFGEDLMGDKSLDEVILSYLADDVEGEKK